MTNFKLSPWLSVKALARLSIAILIECELNAPAPCCGCGRGTTVCGACRTEHAHTVTKWHLSTNLATKCVKNDLLDKHAAMTKLINSDLRIVKRS